MVLNDDPEVYVNFSEALFGVKDVVMDDDVRRIPSVLSLFSEVSLEHDQNAAGSPSFPAFISPKNKTTMEGRVKTLSSVTEGGSEKGADVDGNKNRSASMMGNIPRGISFNDSLQKLGVQTVDVEDWDSDDEGSENAFVGGESGTDAPAVYVGDAAPLSSSAQSEEAKDVTNPLYMTASFVQSMSEYAFRREALLKKIDEGELVAEMTPSKEGIIAPYDQVNPDFYSDENQARRRHIKKHPQFVKIAERLWGCIDMIKDSEGMLDKSSYLKVRRIERRRRAWRVA